MSNGAANVSVWVGEKFVCIKIAGRANFQCSIDFKTLINHLHQQGHSRFVIDVGECQLMDSTFLGVLAGLGLKFGPQQNGSVAGSLEILNASDRIFDMLDNLGIAHLFKLMKGTAPAASELIPVGKSTASTDRAETAKTCLEAHRLLMELNPANVAKFKDVTKFLEEDLKKLQQ
jgi:anti-anti-sigma regulatory factor